MPDFGNGTQLMVPWSSSSTSEIKSTRLHRRTPGAASGSRGRPAPGAARERLDLHFLGGAVALRGCTGGPAASGQAEELESLIMRAVVPLGVVAGKLGAL